MWKSSSKPSSSVALVFALLVSGAAQAQMASRNQKVDVLRVGSRLACQCGGCSDTVATCSMYGCWSHSAKEKIAKMQAAGISDSAIIDDFIKAYGKGIYRGAPNTFGWLVPYLILALGTVVVIAFVRRARRRKPSLVMDPRLSQYNEQIEKELQNLDR